MEEPPAMTPHATKTEGDSTEGSADEADMKPIKILKNEIGEEAEQYISVNPDALKDEIESDVSMNASKDESESNVLGNVSKRECVQEDHSHFLSFNKRIKVEEQNDEWCKSQVLYFPRNENYNEEYNCASGTHIALKQESEEEEYVFDLSEFNSVKEERDPLGFSSESDGVSEAEEKELLDQLLVKKNKPTENYSQQIESNKSLSSGSSHSCNNCRKVLGNTDTPDNDCRKNGEDKLLQCLGDDYNTFFTLSDPDNLVLTAPSSTAVRDEIVSVSKYDSQNHEVGQKTAKLKDQSTSPQERKDIGMSENQSSSAENACLEVFGGRTESNDKYCCEKCGECFSDYVLWVNHQCTHNSVVLLECFECGNVYTSEKSLMDHMNVHIGPFLCPFCPSQFYHSNVLYTHIQHIHSEEKAFKCEVCGNEFKFKVSLTEHLRGHEKGKLTCKVCRVVFTTKGGLSQHMSIHKPREFSHNINVVVQRKESNIQVPSRADENPYPCSENGQIVNKGTEPSLPMLTNSGQQQYECCLCSNTYGNNDDLKKHMFTHCPEKRFKCLQCGKTFSKRSYLTVHMRTHTGEMPFRCGICSEAFISSAHVTKHMKTHIGEYPHSCGVCNKAFKSICDLSAHMPSHVGVDVQYKCNRCKKVYSRSGDLKKHILTHSPQKYYKCSQCEKTFVKRSSLTIHMRTHTGEMPFRCSVCNKAFISSANVSKHMKTHIDENPHSCGVCSKEFKSSSDLSAHMLSHVGGDVQHKCSRCEKVCSNSDDLEKHILTHSPQKYYKCSQCQKTFVQKCFLTVHMRTHAAEMSFKCTSCDKSFSSRTSAEKHRKTHEGEKSYTCRRCNKTFERSTDLSVHMHSHEGERPFKCDQCGKMYAKRYQLSRHMSCHTDQRPYVCPECGASFRLSRYLSHHRKRVHKITST